MSTKDDLKKAKALQKEYLREVAKKQTTDDFMTWILRRKKESNSMKGFGSTSEVHANRAKIFARKMRESAKTVRQALARKDCDAAFTNLMLMEKYHSRYTSERFGTGKGKLPSARATNSVARKFKKACLR